MSPASRLIQTLDPAFDSEEWQNAAFQTPITGDTAVIACTFNPCNYRSQRRNLIYFLKYLAVTGVPVFMAELTFDGQPGILPDSDRVLKIKAPSRELLWQKESLINAVEKIVPPEITKLAWLDADVIIPEDEWLPSLSAALDEKPIVQAFKRCVFTDHELRESGARAGCGYATAIGHPRKTDWRLFHCGFGWAARRELWSQYGGQIECLSGSGDSLIALGFMDSLTRQHSHAARLNDAMWQHVTAWGAKVAGWTKGDIGCLPVDMIHLWHGSVERRRYRERQDMLGKLDPGRHLEHDASGLLQWTDAARREAPGMIAELHDYFSHRQEDTPDA